jgi:TolB-like protein
VSSLLLAILIAVALPLRRRANTQDAIAVMALQDSCGSSEGTWLGAALQETLMDQLQTSGKLHVLRRADISRRLGGLKINTSAGIDSVALKRMSADYGYRFAVTGTYWTSDGALRVELHAIDLASGETFATVAEAGQLLGTLDMMARAGGRLQRAVRERYQGTPGTVLGHWLRMVSRIERRNTENKAWVVGAQGLEPRTSCV